MEPATAGLLAVFANKCLSTEFAVGIFCNLLASLGYDAGKASVMTGLRRLREAITSGIDSQNHDLLRGIWTAQNEALVLACEEVLRTEKRLRTGGWAIPEKLTDIETWWWHYSGNDTETPKLLELRRRAIKNARNSTKESLAVIVERLAGDLTVAPDLFQSGSELGTESFASLRQKTTEAFVTRLHAYWQADTKLRDVPFPHCLEKVLQSHWFDYLRLAFRQLLKQNSNAKSAYEFLIWEKIEHLPLKFDVALEHLEHLDTALDQIQQGQTRIEEAVQALLLRDNPRVEDWASWETKLETLPEIQAHVRRLDDTLAELHRTLSFLRQTFEIRPFKPERPDLSRGVAPELLRPECRAFPLIGREADLASLLRWVHEGLDISIRVLGVGPGAGKTRLGLELLLRLQEDKGDSWVVGRVSAKSLGAFDRNHDWDTWTWDRPTAVMVDYALESLEPLKHWLARISDCHRQTGNHTPPLRLLLIEREASARYLVEKLLEVGNSSSVGDLRAWFSPPEPVKIQPLTEPSVRRALLEVGMEIFASETGSTAPKTFPSDSTEVDRLLEKDDWKRPLHLLFAAHDAVEEGSVIPVLRRSSLELIKRAAERERHLLRMPRWPKDSPKAPHEAEQKFRVRVVVLATLCGGLSETQARELAEAEHKLLARKSQVSPDDVVDFVHSLWSDPENYLSPVKPDVVGERLLHMDLESFGDDGARVEFVTRIAKAKPATVFEVLKRTSQDLPSDDSRQFVFWLEACCTFWHEHHPDLFEAFASLLPRFSISLLKITEACARLQLATARQAHSQSPKSEAALSRLASLLNDHAVSLAEAGERERALAPAEEAVKIRRNLAALNWDAYAPDLAMSLNNLGNRLSELGRRQEALAPAEEAVKIYRDLAALNWDAYAPDLAMSLNNLGNRLSELGQRQGALAPAEEAVKIRRNLATLNWDAYAPALAAALNNLGNRLSNLGQRQEALAPAEEAVKIRRNLAALNWDAYAPDLAGALNNLGARLSELGQRQEALAPAEEAVKIYRDLAALNWDAYAPDLAMSLNNLGTLLSALGRRQEALAPAEEAVKIYRDLAALNWDAYAPDLAGALNNLGTLLSKLGRHLETLAPAEEAVKIYRNLAALNWDAYAPDLAMSLNNLGNRLSKLGRHLEALAPAEEAVKIYRDLAALNWDAYAPDLAMSLNNLGALLSELGRRQEALAPAEEAVKIYRDLAALNWDAYAPDLAMSLNNLGNRLSELGRSQEALAPAEEAVKIYRDLTALNWDAYAPVLAISHGALGSILEKSGDAKEAWLSFGRGIESLCPAFLKGPLAYQGLMVALMRGYLRLAQHLGLEPDLELLRPILEILSKDSDSQ